MNFLIQSIIVFFGVAIVDFFWTRYFQATAEKKATQAGIFSSCIILFGAITTRAYVHDGWLIIPAALGAYVGTFLTVKHHKS
jgi:hypothetical protein